jgi:hypothetical protein
MMDGRPSFLSKGLSACLQFIQCIPDAPFLTVPQLAGLDFSSQRSLRCMQNPFRLKRHFAQKLPIPTAKRNAQGDFINKM